MGQRRHRVQRVRALALLLVLLLAGCQSAGPGPAAPLGFRQVSTFDGQGLLGPLEVGPIPFTFPVRYWGQGTITLQYPAQPHVVFQGDGGYVVEPLTPSQRPQLEAAIARGEFLILHGTTPVGLSPPGSIPKE